MNSQPTESFSTPRPARPLWRRILKWTIRVIVAIVVLAAVAWGIFDYVSARELEVEISKIKAAGQPLTLAELEKSLPRVAEADDAAPFYKAAIALRRTSTNEQVNRLMDCLLDWAKAPSTQPATAPANLDRDIEQVLAENALALQMADRGAALPQCAYDLGLSNGIAGALPQLSDSRALAKVLCLRTLHLARQKEAKKAAESLLSSLRMLRMFDRQPILVVGLVKIACTALFVQAVPAVLEAGPLSDQELAELESALAQADMSGKMQQLWIAERVYALELFRNLIAVPGELMPSEPARLPEAYPHGVMARPIFRMMLARKLQLRRRYVEATGKGWPGASDAVRAIPKGGYGIFGLFAEILAPGMEKAFDLMGRIIGQVRSAQVAVMIERYRLAKGRLPESLAELRGFVGADLPADPFTGGQLIYKVQGEGFLVYSVGEDKTDDGGPSVAPRQDWGVDVHPLAR